MGYRDDQASRAAVTAGNNGRLRAAVKQGIGVDNIDFDAFKDLAIPVTNTPICSVLKWLM